MRRLRLESLSLLSLSERAARKVTFDPNLTVIKGGNDTGKSHLLKSIYWVLGAEPAVINPAWQKANVIGLLEFEVDGDRYSVIRAGKRFGVFDGAGKLIKKTTNVTADLTPTLASILNYRLILTSRGGDAETPPPAYCFLPFYIDQDVGWQRLWQSFANLGQYTNWRRDVVFYHSGIRPNEYYYLSGELGELKAKKTASEGEHKVMSAAYGRIKERRRSIGIDLDPASFRLAVAELLRELSSLREWRTGVSEKLSTLSNERSLLEHQIHIAKAALEEFDKDYKFIRSQAGDTILCPTCGTAHENSFTSKFSLLTDREACRRFLWESVGQLEKTDRALEKQKLALGKANARIGKIDKLLQQKKGRLKLGDVIDAKGEKVAFDMMRKEVDDITTKLAELSKDMSVIEKKLAELVDPDRKKEIEEFYIENMTSFMGKLHVDGVNPGDVEKIDTTIKETGSDRPRVILSYFMSYLHTVNRYSSACMCPIVIDTPKQQDLDDLNARAAFDLIFNSSPAGAQIILGTVDLDGVPHKGLEIELHEKRHLLQAGEFDAVDSRLRPLYDQIL